MTSRENIRFLRQKQAAFCKFMRPEYWDKLTEGGVYEDDALEVIGAFVEFCESDKVTCHDGVELCYWPNCGKCHCFVALEGCKGTCDYTGKTVNETDPVGTHRDCILARKEEE